MQQSRLERGHKDRPDAQRNPRADPRLQAKDGVFNGQVDSLLSLLPHIFPSSSQHKAKSLADFQHHRYFAKLPTTKPIQRGSWGLETGSPLFLPPTHPDLSLRTTQDPSLSLSSVNLRIDWQTLRRLPLSGSIVFNFKALFTPVLEFRDEARIPALLGKVLKEGKRELMGYKGTWHVEHVVLPALERWKEEQVASGLVEKGWEERTLDEYPLFEGWGDKWHRQQGF